VPAHAKNRKWASLDNLRIEIFKFGGSERKAHMSGLFNNIVDKNHIPKEWQTGELTNKYRKSKHKCENYRAVTSLPTACKLFAGMMNDKLNAHFLEGMTEEGCGFGKECSSLDATFAVQQRTGDKKIKLTIISFIC